jgi:hypothetical protein
MYFKLVAAPAAIEPFESPRDGRAWRAFHPARFWFVESHHSFFWWHRVHNSARILLGLCAFCKTSEQPPPRIGKYFRRRNATGPKQSHHFARLA